MLDKIKRTNVYRSANPYIYVNQPIDTKLYDGLYEQWDRPTHKRWQDFFDVYKVKVTFNEVLKQHKNDTDEKYVGYWFFKQRTDRRSISLNLGHASVEYKPNALLIVNAKKTFDVVNKGQRMPAMLNCFIRFNEQQQERLIGLLGR